jgi:hypothetical protein
MRRIFQYESFVIIFIIFIAYSCKDKVDILNSNASMTLESDSIKTFSPINFEVKINHRGVISDGFWYKNGIKQTGIICLAGLWIGMEKDGVAKGNIVSTKSLKSSNFTSQYGNRNIGVYYLDVSNNYGGENWPTEYGAPTDNLGQPKVYGDAMCWTSLQSDSVFSGYSFLDNPINGLRVTESVYGYKRDDLKDVIFIRYGITNTSSENWNNVYAGFYSDTDLNDALSNKTGYDSARSISYTYYEDCKYVTGFTFLETPQNTGVLSHRIMRKNNYLNPEFGEYSFNSAEQIIYALNGLSNLGEPMINPITGNQTKFAFTGDPVSKTGWLDTSVDVRSLLSTKPFSLGVGETTWFTIVWVFSEDSDFTSSLAKFKSKFDEIRKNVSLWQFD